MKRLVVLGASNARRCLPTIFSAARAVSGTPVTVYGAIGHGRSYGSQSNVLGRALPGILECGLWAALETSERDPLDAVVSDAGNDILYGFSVAEILGWAGECLTRFEKMGARITVMGLPVETIDRLGPARFLMFRSIFFPSSRLGLEAVRSSVRKLDGALRLAAEARKIRFVEPRGEWYGFDPIHIRFRDARAAWAEILGVPLAAMRRFPTFDALRIRLARPRGNRCWGPRMPTPSPRSARATGARSGCTSRLLVPTSCSPRSETRSRGRGRTS